MTEIGSRSSCRNLSIFHLMKYISRALSQIEPSMSQRRAQLISQTKKLSLLLRKLLNLLSRSLSSLLVCLFGLKKYSEIQSFTKCHTTNRAVNRTNSYCDNLNQNEVAITDESWLRPENPV